MLFPDDRSERMMGFVVLTGALLGVSCAIGFMVWASFFS